MNSLSKLSVNGATVAVDASGWGTDFVELRATDGAGNATTRTCAFLPSDVWVRDGSRLSNTISVKARQAVFDDSNQTDALDPFADIFATTLNSQRLNTGIDEALSAASPLKPDSCDATLVGSCVLRSEVLYRDLTVAGLMVPTWGGIDISGRKETVAPATPEAGCLG